MERMGLVSQVETELERMISQQLLPADGSLPSEQKLARCFGVSRSTLREALRRLSARGLVVQHPGRKTRAVALDETVTLENLSVALHDKDKANPDRWRLLEGFFALKRDVTVELLAACCEGTEKADLERLEQACFALREAAHWDEEGRGWARQEFALLRLAAQVADRPGHLLLIHSLERTFWSMASWVQPLLNSEAVDEWALCAMYALGERNAQGLRQELPPLLQRCEARLRGSREPDGPEADACETPSTTPVEPYKGAEPAPEAAREELPSAAANTLPVEPHEDGEPAPEPAREEPPGAAPPNLSGCRTGSAHAPPAGAPGPGLLPPALATRQSERHPGGTVRMAPRTTMGTHSPPLPPPGVQTAREACANAWMSEPPGFKEP
jgi:DNA-binding FadR family transcriptional regulator